MAAKHRTSRALVAVFAASILVATACTTPGPSASAAPTAAASATEAPQKGGRIIEGSFSDIRTIQPILVTDTPSGRITDLLYDSILVSDPQNGEPKPGMAKFSVGSDGKSYTFEIDAKANWSDGKPVIAEDWATGTKAVAKSKVSLRQSAFDNIIGFKAFREGTASTISGIAIDPANPKKWTVTLDKVQCDGIFDLAGYTLPAHVFGKYVTAASKDEIDKAPENDNPTVFSGPFKFKEWRKGDQVILTRNDAYWKGAPHVDEFVYKVVADATVAAAQIKTGELNFYGGLEPKDLADMERVDTVKIDKYQQRSYTYIGWRVNSPTATALADKRVRQALAYGLNMDDVIKAVLFDQGKKQVAHHVPVQWAYPDPTTLNQYAYDAAKAEDLIKQAGYTKGADGFYAKDGKKISFTIRTNAGNKARETLAQVASEQYKKIGVDAKTQFEAFQGLVTQLTEGHQSVEAVIIGWANLGNDPYSTWHSSQTPDPATKKTGFNFTFFKSAELDKAIEEGRSPANGDCSVATRKKHYATFNKILNEEQPYNFGFSPLAIAVTAKNLQNFKPGPFSTTYNIHEWWFKK